MTNNESMDPRTDLSKTELVLLFLLALSIRITYVFWLSEDTTLMLAEDSAYFVQLAQNLLVTGQFVAGEPGTLSPETERVPLYPIFVALVRTTLGSSPVFVAVVQSIIDSATVILITLIAIPMGRIVALLSGLLAAIWPNLVIHSVMLLTDTLFVFFLTATLLFCTRYLRRPNTKLALVIGLLFGLAMMTRAIIQFLPPIFATVIIVVAWQRGLGLRKAVLCGSIFCIAAALPAAPILYRNITQFSAVSLTAQGGNHLLNWVVPMISVFGEGIAFDDASADIQLHYSKMVRDNPPQHLNAFQEDSRRASFARHQLSSQPIGPVIGAWTKGMMINLAAPAVAVESRMRSQRQLSFLGSEGGLYERTLAWLNSSPPLWITVMVLGFIGSAITLVLQLWGLLRLSRFAPWPAIYCVSMFLYFLLIMGPVAAPKYRLPIEPIMILLCAIALVDISTRLRRR